MPETVTDPADTRCGHRRTSLTGAGVYEYCEDCGAVRRRKRPGETVQDQWHVCALCRLPGAA